MMLTMMVMIVMMVTIILVMTMMMMITCGRPTQEASRHECRQSRPEIINFNEYIVFSFIMIPILDLLTVSFLSDDDIVEY